MSTSWRSGAEVCDGGTAMATTVTDFLLERLSSRGVRRSAAIPAMASTRRFRMHDAIQDPWGPATPIGRAGPTGPNASMSISLTGRLRTTSSAGCLRRRLLHSNGDAMEIAVQVDASSGCAVARLTASTADGWVRRTSSVGRPTPRPNALTHPSLAAAGELVGRAMGAVVGAAAALLEEFGRRRSPSTRPGSCSARSTGRWPRSRAPGSAPTIWMATPGCAPRPPARR